MVGQAYFDSTGGVLVEYWWCTGAVLFEYCCSTAMSTGAVLLAVLMAVLLQYQTNKEGQVGQDKLAHTLPSHHTNTSAKQKVQGGNAIGQVVVVQYQKLAGQGVLVQYCWSNDGVMME